jgi:hypothetical protein
MFRHFFSTGGKVAAECSEIRTLRTPYINQSNTEMPEEVNSWQ